MAFRIKIINGTDWPTREFRKLFLACAKHEGMAYDGTYTVELYYPRGGGGWGYYNRRHMKIALPNWNGAGAVERAAKTSAVGIASTIIHEMGHNRGLRHKDMSTKLEHAAAREVCEALGMVYLHRGTSKAKPKPTREEKARAELERIDAKLAQLTLDYERATARWTKKRKKAAASVRRYDRLAADKKAEVTRGRGPHKATGRFPRLTPSEKEDRLMATPLKQDKLRLARDIFAAAEARGWTDATLAQQLGLHPATIYGWRKGTAPLATVRHLAVALNAVQNGGKVMTLRKGGFATLTIEPPSRQTVPAALPIETAATDRCPGCLESGRQHRADCAANRKWEHEREKQAKQTSAMDSLRAKFLAALTDDELAEELERRWSK